MIGLGTIINSLAVLVGGILGMMLGNALEKRFQDILMSALGLATMFIGAGGAMAEMLTISESSLETQGTMLLIFSLVFGSLIGEFIDIEDKLEKLGIWLKNKVKAKNNEHFVEGFVSTSLVICVGAMAIVGALQDGLTGDYSTLVAKAILDFVIVMVFASTMGLGCVFSCLPIFVYQGAITLFATFLKPIMTATLISHLSFVGSVLIFAVGVNLCFGNRIKVGNMLPAMLIPFIYILFV